MDLKLIYPPSTSLNHSSGPVLGLAVLKSFLEREGYSVDIEDMDIKRIDQRIDVKLFEQRKADVLKYLMTGEASAEVQGKVSELLSLTRHENYPYVGFSIMGIRQLLPSLAMAKYLKETYGSKILLGGFYPQCNARDILNRFSFVDYIVCQEGELALKHILEGKDEAEVNNLYYRDGSEIKGSKSRLLTRINENPVANFDGLPLETYIRHKGYLEIPYELARGCSADCAFCSFPKFNGLRMKKMDVIMDELKRLKQKYESNQFIFYNAEVNVSNEWLKRFLKRMIQDKVDIRWVGYLIPNLDEESVELLHASGCKEVKLGFETGSDAVLSRMGKLHNMEQAENTVRLLHKHNVPFYSFFMCGYPYETDDDHHKTLKFILSNKGIITKARVTEFELEYDAPMFHEEIRYKIKRRPLKQDLLVPSLKIPFDEIEGLTWEEKLAEQTHRKHQIEKLFDKCGITIGDDYCRFTT